MILNLFAYVIIPFYTILFARNTNWFTMNFSVLSGLANRSNAFLLWGVIVGIYFFYCLKKIVKHVPRPKKESILAHTAALLLLLAVLIPYLPEQLPFQAFLHVVFAFTSSVLLMLCLLFTILKLNRISHGDYLIYLYWFWAIAVICIILLYAAGIVSSALEIFFTISCAVLVRLLYKKTMLEPLTRSR